MEFIYNYEPVIGKTLIVFTLEDINDSIQYEEVEIYYYPIAEVVTEDVTPSDRPEIVDLSILIKKLIPLSDGYLKKVLENVKTGPDKILTLQELFDYLLLQSEVSNYSDQDIIALALEFILLEDEDPYALLESMTKLAFVIPSS